MHALCFSSFFLILLINVVELFWKLSELIYLVLENLLTNSMKFLIFNFI